MYLNKYLKIEIIKNLTQKDQVVDFPFFCENKDHLYSKDT